MDEYFFWSLTGGGIALIIVFLCYMGFFSKVQCWTECTDELIMAYRNFNSPYLEMDHQGRLLRETLNDIFPHEINTNKQINVYYDDPRFTTKLARWAIAFEVKDNVLESLSFHGFSFVRIPSGTCLTVVFPYRNFLSYGLGARKAFDTMVATAQGRKIEIATPPMEIYVKQSAEIRYILYLDNEDVIHSMCDAPFETITV